MNAPPDIFDPRHYAAVRRPTAEASHLPPWCYTSEQFFQREMATIFRKNWVLVGREEDIAQPGDYITPEVGGAPLIVIRDAKGRLGAFANSCRHRGAKLLEGRGRCKAHIVCPYHSWSFDLEGRLAGAPGMKDVKGFDLALHNLLPVRAESWAGFLFVNLDPDAPGLMAYLGEVADLLASYDFGGMVATYRKTYRVAGNWKLIVENGMEDYHTATVHRGSIGTQKLDILTGPGNWEAGFFESKKTIAILPGEGAALPWIKTLDERSRRGTHFVLIYPAAIFACNQDGVFWLDVRPLGPALSDVELRFAFPRSTVALPDFENIAEGYYHRCNVSIPEDCRIAEVQQNGLISPLARTGRVSMQEVIVHSFANWLLDRVLDAPTGVRQSLPPRAA
jgi:phenylpropionate dioxygenase-like ring-hydroxylating dioxygenase large terminal subunit